MGCSFGTDNYFMETDDELENEYDELNTKDTRTDSLKHQQGFLGVPPTGQESRRSSAMTCCSTESSYLERRCSALNFGLMELPTTIQRRISSVSRRSSADIWEYYYPDIQIIQATPKTSPCLSERSVHERIKNSSIPTTTYTSTKSPITTSNGGNGGNGFGSGGGGVSGLGGTTSSSTNYYYGQSNKIFPKSDDSMNYYHSFMEKRKICHTLSADNSYTRNYDQHKFTTSSSSSSSRKYDDNNELKLIVERKISDPSSILNNYNYNNNHSYNNIYTSSYDSLQLFRDNEGDGGGGGGDIKRAPLASLSSFKISSVDYQDSDLKSLGSDSVFGGSYADTDDDMEQFSTDSDELSGGSLCDDNEKSIGRSSFQQNQKQQKHKLSDHSQLQIIRNQQTSTSRSDPCPFSKSDDNKKPSYSSTGSCSSSKRIRSSLERHRTISASSSNDRILLIPSSKQPSFESHPHDDDVDGDDDYEYDDRQIELPKSATYSSYIPSSSSSSMVTSSSIIRQLPSVSSKTMITAGSSSLQIYDDDSSIIKCTSTSTGTTTSSCSSSHKTEIHRPLSSAVLAATTTTTKSTSLSSSTRNLLGNNRITRTSSFSYDNNNDNLNNISNRSHSSLSKRYYSSRHHDKDDDEDKSKLSNSSSKNECVEVNVIIENRSQQHQQTTTTNIISPSVILELPVITLPSPQVNNDDDDDDDPPRDPSLPGTSRKWSKETLF